MLPLTGVAQAYAWGSESRIPAFLATPPPGGPVAELWFGAHPSGPSPVPGDDLAGVVAEDRGGCLGVEVQRRFAGQLPYLLKLIAPAGPLSLQVHPNRDQARAGWSRERARRAAGGVLNYRDAEHKPELVYALEPFEAVSGFRVPRRSAEILDGLDTSLARELVRVLRDPAAGGVRAAFTHVLRFATAAQIEETVEACAARLAAGESTAVRSDAIVTDLARRYPGDPGAVATLLLNPVSLRPGEAMFIPTGAVHAYLSGFGVELMANSDNVLRAGLTPKHVDTAELLRVVDDTAAPPIRLAAEAVTEQVSVFYPPVDDFQLGQVRLDGAPVRVPFGGPRIALVIAGEVAVRAGAQELTLRRGQAAFVRADEPALEVSGTGTMLVAAVP